MARSEAPERTKSDMDWEIDDGVRTMMKAEEIKKDKKLYPLVMKKMGEQMAAMSRVMGGKSLKSVLDKRMQEE